MYSLFPMTDPIDNLQKKIKLINLLITSVLHIFVLRPLNKKIRTG